MLRWLTSPRSGPRAPSAADAPSGLLKILGPFARAHRPEIIALVRAEAQQETAAHPSHRIVAIRTSPDAIDVTTTDLDLPRRIGGALQRVHRGALELRPSADQRMLTVRWSR